MKLIVRAFVVILAISGAAATTLTPSASAQKKVTSARVSFMPIPTCPPDDPDACHITDGHW